MKHEGFNLKITTADGKFEKVEMRFISGFWYDMIAWIEQEYIQDGKRATVEIVD